LGGLQKERRRKKERKAGGIIYLPPILGSLEKRKEEELGKENKRGGERSSGSPDQFSREGKKRIQREEEKGELAVSATSELCQRGKEEKRRINGKRKKCFFASAI